jgi:hypothetical protein
MYGELASVREIVDLSRQEALDRAETFLIQEGYTPMRRAVNSLTVYKRPPGQAAGQNTLNLTVAAVPQPGGGVRIKVRGNDREGVQKRQAAWIEWSETLPKKREAPTSRPEEQQERTVETPKILLPLPPTVESPHSAPPVSDSSSVALPPGREKVWRRFALPLGGARMEREAVLGIGISVFVGLLLAIPLYVLGYSPVASTPSALVSNPALFGLGEPSSEEVVRAFSREGLEVGVFYPVEEEGPAPVPKTYKEGTRFTIPSLGEDFGGRVFTFESEEDLQPVRDYYEGLGKGVGMFNSHVYVEGNVLLQINGQLPKDQADDYEAVLREVA